jgi:CheY-like chemotaxis protein
MPEPLRILIVEDHVPILRLFADWLRSLDTEPMAMSDTALAQEQIHTQKFDAIVLDLKMPGLDGYQLTQEVRNSVWNVRTPVIIITGSDDPHAMARCFEAGATFFLPKPVDREALLRVLHAAQGAASAERRHSERAHLSLAVECQTNNLKTTAQCENLSEDGMLLHPEMALEAGSIVRMKFQMDPLIAPVQATGKVVRVDDTKAAGVRFTWLTPEDRQRLRDFLHSRS